ncbi:hypothetical protein [Desulfobacter curvatus]|uniref:hypothetical protein n=1 Tax=Desulfobacter curvatus TaxID=2290 RepID=UPI0003621BE4|nr:hypothetical protein [Desulfobacter curvatus]
MKIKLNTLLVILISLILFSGCAGQPIKLSSSQAQAGHKNVDFSKGREISATASGFQLLLFIPIQINSRHERAHQMLIDQAKGDYITDIQVQESWSYGFVGTVYTTTLKAMAHPYK